MTTLRVNRRSRYATIDRRTVNDDRLSFRARGVLVWLLDKPDDWRTDSSAIAEAGKEGRDSVRAVMKELEAAGYLRRERVQDPETGRWSSVSTVFEVPPEDGFPGVGNPGVGEPVVGAPGAITKTETEELKPKDQSQRLGGKPPNEPEPSPPVEDSKTKPRGEPTPASQAPSVVEPKPPDKPTSPLKRDAHRLTVLAFEQPVKPTLRRERGSPFAAVLGIIEGALRAGRPVREIETAVTSGLVEVWTINGLNTAIAHARRRPPQQTLEESFADNLSALNGDPG